MLPKSFGQNNLQSFRWDTIVLAAPKDYPIECEIVNGSAWLPFGPPELRYKVLSPEKCCSIHLWKPPDIQTAHGVISVESKATRVSNILTVFQNLGET